MPARSRPIIGSPGPAPSNVEVVATALREAIVDGRLPPGERIKEAPLANQIGVSRGPIREAIRLLEHDGLVQLVRNKGATVPKPAARDVVEVYAMRAALGSLALSKLMLEQGTLPVTSLERELARFEQAVRQGRALPAADADLSYQFTIVQSAGLTRVTRKFEQLTWQVRIFISTMDIRYDDKLRQMLDEVVTLHAAIVAGRADEAERLWREKFERWVRDFVSQLAEEFDRDLWVALTSGHT